LVDEKIRRSAALFWVGLWVVEILEILFSGAVLQRTFVDSPAFLEPGLAEKIVVCALTTRLSKN
jgi:hypothetical protein